MADVDSSTISTRRASKKKPGRPRKSKTRKARKLRTAPAPTPELVSADAQPSPQPESQSLFGKLFQSQPQPEAAPEIVSGNALAESEQPCLTIELPPEVAAELASIPRTVADEAPGPVAGEDEALDPESVRALMEQVSFEYEDVRDMLGELFDYLSEKMDSEHWKLTERQARILGKPAHTLVNALWQKLLIMLPDILGKWCETTPGAAAFIAACGIVIGPKIWKQKRLKAERPAKKPVQSAPVNQKPQAPAAGEVGKGFDIEEKTMEAWEL